MHTYTTQIFSANEFLSILCFKNKFSKEFIIQVTENTYPGPWTCYFQFGISPFLERVTETLVRGHTLTVLTLVCPYTVALV